MLFCQKAVDFFFYRYQQKFREVMPEEQFLNGLHNLRKVKQKRCSDSKVFRSSQITVNRQ